MNIQSKILFLLVLCSSFLGMKSFSAETLNVYTSRKSELVQPLLKQFTKKTGIEVNLLTGKDVQLLQRIKSEGKDSPADIIIVASVSHLATAHEMDILQKIPESALTEVSAHLRDPKNFWTGFSMRSRVIFYSKEKVRPDEIKTYADLKDPKWKKRICTRSSQHPYNQSLLASFIVHEGEKAALDWAQKVKNNLARDPQGGDTDQLRAVALGECDVAIANDYYYSRMLATEGKDKDLMQKVGILFPNQDSHGAHINISGAAIAKYSKNKAAAIQLIEFALSIEGQEVFTFGNYEFPVVKNAVLGKEIQQYGAYKKDNVSLNLLGDQNKKASQIFDKVQWK